MSPNVVQRVVIDVLRKRDVEAAEAAAKAERVDVATQ